MKSLRTTMLLAHAKFRVSAISIYRPPSIPSTTISYSLICHLGSAFMALLKFKLV